MAEHAFTAPKAKHVRRLVQQHLASESGEIDWDAIARYNHLPVETCKFIAEQAKLVKGAAESAAPKAKPKAKEKVDNPLE